MFIYTFANPKTNELKWKWLISACGQQEFTVDWTICVHIPITTLDSMVIIHVLILKSVQIKNIIFQVNVEVTSTMLNVVSWYNKPVNQHMMSFVIAPTGVWMQLLINTVLIEKSVNIWIYLFIIMYCNILIYI